MALSGSAHDHRSYGRRAGPVGNRGRQRYPVGRAGGEAGGDGRHHRMVPDPRPVDVADVHLDQRCRALRDCITERDRVGRRRRRGSAGSRRWRRPPAGRAASGSAAASSSVGGRERRRRASGAGGGAEPAAARRAGGGAAGGDAGTGSSGARAPVTDSARPTTGQRCISGARSAGDHRVRRGQQRRVGPDQPAGLGQRVQHHEPQRAGPGLLVRAHDLDQLAQRVRVVGGRQAEPVQHGADAGRRWRRPAGRRPGPARRRTPARPTPPRRAASGSVPASRWRGRGCARS